MSDEQIQADIHQLTLLLVPPDAAALASVYGIDPSSSRQQWEQAVTQHIQELLAEGEVIFPHTTRLTFISVSAEHFVSAVRSLQGEGVLFCLVADLQPPPFETGVRLAQQVRTILAFDQIIIIAQSRQQEAAARKLGMHFIVEPAVADGLAHVVLTCFEIMSRELQPPPWLC